MSRQFTPRPLPTLGRAFALLVRKLHARELTHLRTHAARLEAENDRLAARNERLQSELYDEEGRADMFQDALSQVEGHRLGLTRGGALLVIADGAEGGAQ